MSKLMECIGSEGNILAYNAAFEKKCLKGLAQHFPEHSAWIQTVINRVVDLMVPFQQFYYYNPKEGGSVSLKSVFPAMTGNGYDMLDISGGEFARLEYLRVTQNSVSSEEKAKVFKALEEYCKQDVVAMVEIFNKLKLLSA
jgi:hypothetical protein